MLTPPGSAPRQPPACSASAARRSTPTSAAATSARSRSPARHASGATRATTSSGCGGGPRSAAIPDKAAARALQWGLPVLESSITFIDGQRLYYRGHDAVALARSRSFAEVASLIWSGRFDGTFSTAAPRPAAPAAPRWTRPALRRAGAGGAGAAPAGIRWRSISGPTASRRRAGASCGCSPTPPARRAPSAPYDRGRARRSVGRERARRRSAARAR